METKIIGFSVDAYNRFHTTRDGNDIDKGLIEECKNIVPLEKMTPKQRYELALADDEDAIIYDSLDAFLTDLNDEVIYADGYFFYQYCES